MLAFRYIRRVTIDEHLFGADITISAVGGGVKQPSRKLQAKKLPGAMQSDLRCMQPTGKRSKKSICKPIV